MRLLPAGLTLPSQAAFPITPNLFANRVRAIYFTDVVAEMTLLERLR
jgi:hypothetical protein